MIKVDKTESINTNLVEFINQLGYKADALKEDYSDFYSKSYVLELLDSIQLDLISINELD